MIIRIRIRPRARCKGKDEEYLATDDKGVLSWLLWVGRRGIVSRALNDLVVSAAGRQGGYDKTSLTWEACYPYGAQQHDDKDTGG